MRGQALGEARGDRDVSVSSSFDVSMCTVVVGSGKIARQDALLSLTAI